MDVAIGVVQVAAPPEVGPGPGVVRGHDVPGRAAAGEQVERGEPVREVGGIVVRRVLRGHEPDVGRHRRERRQHGLRVRPARDVQGVRTAEVLAQAQAFAQEEGREQPALGGLGDPPERLKVGLRTGFGRLPDGAGVDALEEDPELDLPARLEFSTVVLCHVLSSVFRANDGGARLRPRLA